MEEYLHIKLLTTQGMLFRPQCAGNRAVFLRVCPMLYCFTWFVYSNKHRNYHHDSITSYLYVGRPDVMQQTPARGSEGQKGYFKLRKAWFGVLPAEPSLLPLFVVERKKADQVCKRNKFSSSNAHWILTPFPGLICLPWSDMLVIEWIQIWVDP